MDKNAPTVHVVDDPAGVYGARAHAARLTVGTPMVAFALLSCVAIASSQRTPQIVVAPAIVIDAVQDADAVPEPLAVNLVALQGLATIDVADTLVDVEANLTAIQRVLRQQGAVGFIARVQHDAATGQTMLFPILEQDADRITSPASTIKLLTASAIYSLVVPLAERAGMTPLEYMQTTMLTVGEEAASQPGSSFGLRAGDQISLLGVLYAMGGLSANDATAVGTQFIAEQTGMDALQFINQYAQTLGATQTTVTVPSGLHQSDYERDGPDNQTTSRDGGRIAAHVILNQPELATIFNQPNYHFTTTGGTPDDDQVVVVGSDGDYQAEFRTSVQLQLDRSVAGRRLDDTARDALLVAKTGFTADGEINGARILTGFAGPDGAMYVMFIGEIGNNDNPAARVFEGQRRFPAVSLMAGRAIEALWQGHDRPVTRAPAELPVAVAVMPREDGFCAARARIGQSDVRRCTRAEALQLARR